MANKTINDLTAASGTPALSVIVEIDDGASKKATLNQVAKAVVNQAITDSESTYVSASDNTYHDTGFSVQLPRAHTSGSSVLITFTGLFKVDSSRDDSLKLVADNGSSLTDILRTGQDYLWYLNPTADVTHQFTFMKKWTPPSTSNYTYRLYARDSGADHISIGDFFGHQSNVVMTVTEIPA